MTILRGELLTDLTQTLRADSLALMLFGSVARGEGRDQSDTDILQIVSRHRRSYKAGGYSVAVYTPESLAEAAVAGSLFVLHLRMEGIVLHDPQRILTAALDRYTAPDSYAPYLAELRMAVNLLNVSGDFYATEWDRCHSLALFLLRSTLYANAAERGQPMFSIPGIVAKLDDTRIDQVYELKYLKRSDSALYWRCVKLVLEYLGTGFTTEPDAAESILMNALCISPLTVAMAQRFLGLGDGGGYSQE